jgi:hypothetical protein
MAEKFKMAIRHEFSSKSFETLNLETFSKLQYGGVIQDGAAIFKPISTYKAILDLQN